MQSPPVSVDPANVNKRIPVSVDRGIRTAITVPYSERIMRFGWDDRHFESKRRTAGNESTSRGLVVAERRPPVRLTHRSGVQSRTARQEINHKIRIPLFCSSLLAASFAVFGWRIRGRLLLVSKQAVSNKAAAESKLNQAIVNAAIGNAIGNTIGHKNNSVLIPATEAPGPSTWSPHRSSADRSNNERRTFGNGIPVASAISRSRPWPCFFKYWRIWGASRLPLAKIVAGKPTPRLTGKSYTAPTRRKTGGNENGPHR